MPGRPVQLHETYQEMAERQNLLILKLIGLSIDRQEEALEQGHPWQSR